jgi:peptidoglycan/xylan/chitin deacetylase (PgdA/CDA1 family)
MRTAPIIQLLLRLPGTRRLSVLAYHRVLPARDPLRPRTPTVEGFEARMRWVAANFDVLPLADAVRALRADRLPRRALSITFDDGYADNHDLALPVLRRLGISATFFIATGYLNGGCMFNDIVIEAVRAAPGPELDLDELMLGRHPLGSDEERVRAIGRILERLKYWRPDSRHAVACRLAERVGATVPTDLMMSSAQVRALAAGGMTIGAHTVTHPILAQIELGEAHAEISASRHRLEEMTGAPVRLFAYPNGNPLYDYRPEHARLVRELGFDAAVSTTWGAAGAGDDLYQIPRFTPWDRPNWRYGIRLTGNLLRASYASG